jgi:hypothetical protein
MQLKVALGSQSAITPWSSLVVPDAVRRAQPVPRAVGNLSLAQAGRRGELWKVFRRIS